jgi:predicted esterase YcpF (UPF0227 family)
MGFIDAMQKITHFLYLHGFRSSPQSVKARKMAALVAAQYPGVTWWCPQLPASPRQAMDLLLAGLGHWPQHSTALMGSSLGGFYATWLTRHLGCPAVLINPAVNPARDLAAYIGEHSAWHDPTQSVFFEAAYVQELLDLQAQSKANPANTLTLIAKGDEVLDWREMLAAHQSGRVRLIEGSDHALSDFDDHLPEILEFLQLA